MSHIYDVVIIGAGPAGSSAAYYLARQGIDVLLLDKFTFPREKACGDALSPRSLTLLKEMDLLDDVVRVGCRYDTIKLIAPRCHSATILLPQRDHRISYGLMLPRLILDDLLLQHAVAHGAQFRSPIRITDIVADEEAVCVQGEYHRHLISFRARLAIVAVGANSGLLLRSGLIKRRPRMALGARVYFEGVPDVIDQAQFYLEGVFPPGYGWIFPISKTAVNVGIGFLPPKKGKPTTTPRTARRAFDAFIHTSLLQHMLGGAHRSGPVMGFPYRCDFPTAPTLGQGVLLVGEAAGLGHPLTGEGIAYALESGKIAAEHLSWMLNTGNVSQESLRWYNWQLRLRFQPLFSLLGMARWAPVLYHSLPYQLSMNALVEGAGLACRIPPIRSLAFYGLGGVPNTYPLSPTFLLKRRNKRSQTDQDVMLLGPTALDEGQFSPEDQDPDERIVDSLM